jgi:hypothetical protein
VTSAALTLRDITEDDWRGVRLLAATSFGSLWHHETFAAWRTLMSPGSSVVVCDGDDLIAMAHYLDMKLTVPGGAVIPAAGITWVGVARPIVGAACCGPCTPRCISTSLTRATRSRR